MCPSSLIRPSAIEIRTVEDLDNHRNMLSMSPFGRNKLNKTSEHVIVGKSMSITDINFKSK